MILHGSILRTLGAGLVLASSVLLVTSVDAASPPASVAKTLNLSLPGPFNGCTVLDSGATPTTNAILDLLRPSAFLTTTNDNLAGEGGAIASAELVSLSPETVVYTIAPGQHWSDGASFSGIDLVSWWLRAKQLREHPVRRLPRHPLTRRDQRRSHGHRDVFLSPTPSGTCSFVTSRRSARRRAARGRASSLARRWVPTTS